MSGSQFEPRRTAKALLAVLGVSLAATASTRCRPHHGERGATSRTLENPRTEPSHRPAPPVEKTHLPTPRSWRLREDSPFTLVAEGLRSAGVTAIDETALVYAEPCDWPAPTGSLEKVRGESLSVWEVRDDHFARPIPNSPTTASMYGAVASGHWPNDFWLRFARAGEQRGAQYQFVHWDGGKWQAIDTGPSEKGLEPYEIFDWYDGTKVVAQIQKWHESVTYAVAPFLVRGQTAHQPPDFSTLKFPREPGREQQRTQIQYAALPTHELFVAQRLDKQDSGHTTITVAYSTQSGEIMLDRVLDKPGNSTAAFVSGRLGPRDVIIAWGDLERFGQHRPWLQLYDGRSSTKLPVPEPADLHSPLVAVWLAGGRLWAQFGYAPSKIWNFEGTSWKMFARVDSDVSVSLAPVTQDGSLWGARGPDLFRFDKDGKQVSVPFLAAPAKELLLFRLVATAPNDVWLVVTAEGQENLIFRTKKMTSILACN
jgi:hypothetical protein